MNHPQGVISQVSADQQIGGTQLVNNYNEQEYYDDNTLIHLNIQGKHYYITRDQLMSLPESLLLCLFPSGVFVDREGQVITNLTPEDEVFIANFPPDCFESIMETYSTAENDLENFPVNEIFDRKPEQQISSPHKGFFGFSSAHNYQPSESDILHQKPAIIVLREDLDYYCIPAVQLSLEGETKEENDTLMEQLMTQIKKAAGSHLCQQRSVFQGLYSSNRMKKPQNGKHSTNNLRQLGPAEQHLMDMLCSSGFREDSNWGNRSQEPGKTVISSLTLCRLMNETVQEFREKVEEAKRRYEERERLSNQKQQQNGSPSQSGIGGTSPSNASTQLPHMNSGLSDSKRKSRLSSFADNVRPPSNSRTKSNHPPPNTRAPTLYELVEKPEINTKLLLFWKKPARKCWWGMECITVDIHINGHMHPSSGSLVLSTNAPQTTVSLPVNLHIRRVWTLELSVVGMQ